ncbi:uncharacterized protein [Elaeis guineensis]|uniref:uncharacterized protein n=1 Tax=Elaeis guineensis var. tenera TaxID=51953 RepID=UPI003C6D50C6
MTMQVLIKKAWSQNTYYGETWMDARNRMMLMYAEALSSSCIQLVQMIQTNPLDWSSFRANYGLHHTKYLTTLALDNASNLEDKTASSIAVRSCMRDLYHYARISGTHVLECIMDTALSAIRREQLQEASDILSLFPLLQPLVAVLGWDLLSGKTAGRRKLMKLLWTSRSQVLRLEEFPLYGKQSDERSCVEYLCDLLCFHLDLSFFVACVNSGRSWNLKNSLLFSQNKQAVDEHEPEVLEPFVENFILERLAVQTPMRVLFDVVPGIKFQDAIELIGMQPIASTSAAWKRMQDIELMHMRYALESAVFALGSMERSVGSELDNQSRIALSYLKDMQTHMESISNAPRKIFMVSIVTLLLLLDEISVDLTQSASSKAPPSLGSSLIIVLHVKVETRWW